MDTCWWVVCYCPCPTDKSTQLFVASTRRRYHLTEGRATNHISGVVKDCRTILAGERNEPVDCWSRPCTITSLFQRSSSESLLIVHRAHLRQFGDRTFCFAAPHLWNDLPRHMRTCDSLHQFKRLLKTYLFKRALYS